MSKSTNLESILWHEYGWLCTVCIGATTPATTPSDENHSPSLERRNHYKQLLEALTEQADTVTFNDLPLEGNQATVDMPTSLKLDVSFAVGSEMFGEREFKIGAAGELFISLITGCTKIHVYPFTDFPASWVLRTF